MEKWIEETNTKERACNTELTVKNNSEGGCAGSQNITCVVHIQTSRNLF